MRVDVTTEIVIDRPRPVVARFAADPDNVTKWYENIKSVEWVTPRPLAIGSRMRFVAHFLGRELAYTYAVTEYVPGELFVMRTAEGPFPMQTEYRWESLPGDRTRMILRNHGSPSGFSGLFAPFMGMAMRRANNKDLALLKDVLERTA